MLVNEFGEIGIDGSFFSGQSQNKDQVFFQEVPGGCMCCAAGLPMQIALGQLLSRAKPDRLLIEPTGLGHPREILQVLSTGYYREILSLQKTLTLVDARKLSDEKIFTNDTFNQQILMADTVVGNKLDLYSEQDRKLLEDYVKSHGQHHVKVIFTQSARIELDQLEGETANKHIGSHHHHHHASNKTLIADQPIPDCGYIKAENEGEGFKSVGWRFAPDIVFDHQILLSILKGVRAERMKAVFITNDGVFGYNLTTDALQVVELDDCDESCIEIISTKSHEQIESELLEARV